MNRQQKRELIHKSKYIKGLGKKKTKGAFGGKNQFLGDYKSLKVLPLQKRDESCNQFGIKNETN